MGLQRLLHTRGVTQTAILLCCPREIWFLADRTHCFSRTNEISLRLKHQLCRITGKKDSHTKSSFQCVKIYKEVLHTFFKHKTKLSWDWCMLSLNLNFVVPIVSSTYVLTILCFFLFNFLKTFFLNSILGLQQN